MPIAYKIKEVVQNRDLQYTLAVINEEESREVRCSLFPMKENLEEYENNYYNGFGQWAYIEIGLYLGDLANSKNGHNLVPNPL